MSNITAWFVGIAVTVAFGAAAANFDTTDEREADRQDTEALSSREFAGQAVCGPHATPEWLDDKTLQCLRHHDDAPSAPHASDTLLAEAAH